MRKMALITHDEEIFTFRFWGVWKPDFKQVGGCCNIEMCRLHLDEIMYGACYPSEIFDSLLKDTAFFYNI